MTNTSVNPARSTSQAIFVGDWALSQLWLFWLAPLVGAAIAGLGYRFLTGESGVELVATTGQDPDSAVTTAGEQAGAAGRRALEQTESRPPGDGADGR